MAYSLRLPQEIIRKFFVFGLYIRDIKLQYPNISKNCLLIKKPKDVVSTSQLIFRNAYSCLID